MISPRTSWRTRSPGFTLIEVLLAVTLLSFLLWVLYDTYITASRIVARCQTGFAPVREGLKVQKVVSRVLASASSNRQRNPKALFAGDDSRLSFTTLNRQGSDPEHPWPIAFVRLAHNPDDGLKLVTHPTFFLSDKEDAAKGTAISFPLVKRVKLSYWDGSDWIREWEATKKGKLPTRVRVELTLQGEGSAPLPWNFDTMIPAQSDLPITGGPVPGMGPPGTPAGPGGAPPVPGFGPGPGPGPDPRGEQHG